MASTPSMLVSFPAPLAGNVFKVLVKAGESVAAGQVVLILEAMKMETEIRATSAGLVSEVLVREGDAVKVGESLMMLS
jgi:oxaloacetate decarboxylase alpha subunit